VRTQTIDVLECPACGAGSFSCHEWTFPSQRANDVEEGFLTCDQCALVFPILGGVLLWLPDSQTYLLKRNAELQSLSATNQLLISVRMREFLDNFAPAVQSVGFTPASWESDPGIQVYKRAQFAALLPKVESRGHSCAAVESLPGYRDFYERCLDIVAPWCKPQHRIVDIGCGVGGFTYRLGKLSSWVLGLDYSLKAAHFARTVMISNSRASDPNPVSTKEVRKAHAIALAQLSGEIEIIAGDITSFPLRANAFDVAVCLNVLEVVSQPELLIQAAAKSVKQDGIFLLTTCFYWRIDRTESKHWLLDANNVKRCLSKHGFQVLEHHERVLWVLPITERYTQLWDSDIFLTRRVA